MEEEGGGMVVKRHWWWAAASAAQFVWAVRSYRSGYTGGDSRLMPLKAFAVASLFVGASATASVSFLHASGIHKVEDVMEVGANVRSWLGVSSRRRDERGDDLS